MHTEFKKTDIRCLTCGRFDTNTYIIINGNECVIVDPAEYTSLKACADMMELSVKGVLITHGHYDHIAAAKSFQDKGVKVYAHTDDVPKCTGEEMGHYLAAYGISPFTPDFQLVDGQIIRLIGLEFKVIHTPGHSKGGVCYLVGDCLLSGDTLMSGTYGRYDFYDGSLEQIKDSIFNKLFALEYNYRVFPGHGRPSMLDDEKKGNMILWS